MVEVGVHAATSLFALSSFLFLFMEDVRSMAGTELVARLAAFSGLTPPRSPVGPKCEAAAACASTAVRARSTRCQRWNLSAGGAAQDARLEQHTEAKLRAFFAPTLEVLANDLVPRSFAPEQPLRRLELLRRSTASGEGAAHAPR
jgi:hypothetical protein